MVDVGRLAVFLVRLVLISFVISLPYLAKKYKKLKFLEIEENSWGSKKEWLLL